MLTIPRGCGVNLKPVCSFLERSVAKDELEVGTSPGQAPLLTAAWDHRTDQGAGPVGPPGAPLPAHGRVMSGIHDGSAGSQPALLSWAPGLPQSPHSCGSWTRPLGIRHVILGPGWPPPGTWLSPGHTLLCGRGHQQLRWLISPACCSPPSPSESGFISPFWALPLPTSPGCQWDGGRNLGGPGPSGQSFLPKASHPRGPRCEHLCPRGHTVTPGSSRRSAPRLCSVGN